MNNYLLGLELLIIGMGTVFLSLYLLSVFLYFSGKLFGPEKKQKNKNFKKAKIKEELDLSEQGISSKKIAAVTATVSELLNSENNYKIISIKKSSQNWKR